MDAFFRVFQTLSVAAVLFVVAGCAENFSRDPDDICQFLSQQGSWFDALEKSSSRWKVPQSLILAFVQHESQFDSQARPPRKRILWVIPGPRRSSAYGYAQALDSTWKGYIKSTGNSGADRDDFDDAVDFVGWYVDNTARAVGLARDDVYRQYLVYHEGARGYRNEGWKKKKWLIRFAKRIELKAGLYKQQLQNCTEEQRRSGWKFWPFN